MDVCRPTGVHLTVDRLVSMKGGEAREVESIWDADVQAALDEDGGPYFVEQKPLEFRLSDVELGKVLGQGSYGVTYTCIIKKRGMVIKFNPEHEVRIKRVHKADTESDQATKNEDDDKNKEDKATKTVFAFNQLDPETLRDIYDEYREEFSNFERIMEPASFKKYTRDQERWVTWDGVSPEANRRQYNELKRDLELFQAHPGYEHMHKLLHFDTKDNISFILSERCDDSLENLMEKHCDESIHEFKPAADGSPSKLWLLLAEHLTYATLFMQERGLVNVDIKPSNILYVDRGGQKHFMISDYGMCSESDYIPKSTDPYKLRLRGNNYYNPHEDVRELMTSKLISVFQVAVTLAGTIDVSRINSETVFLHNECLQHRGYDKSFSSTLHLRAISAIDQFRTLVGMQWIFSHLFGIIKYVDTFDHIPISFKLFQIHLKEQLAAHGMPYSPLLSKWR